MRASAQVADFPGSACAAARTPGTHSRRRTENALAHWVAVAEARFGLRLPAPALRFDLRGRAAGQTLYPNRTQRNAVIRINAELLHIHPREMLDETVPHEVAHVVTRTLHGPAAKPHGAEWREVMRCFGKRPTVCHSLPTAPARRLAYYPYRCACVQPRYLGAIRHHRSQSGDASYRCTRCAAALVYAGGALRGR